MKRPMRFKKPKVIAGILPNIKNNNTIRPIPLNGKEQLLILKALNYYANSGRLEYGEKQLMMKIRGKLFNPT